MTERWCFPESDRVGAPAILADAALIASAWMPHVHGRRVCVQAGGNCGVYPAVLATFFRAVYTAEPDSENFRCLLLNCGQPNIYALRAAFGERSGTTGLHLVDGNVGMHWLEGNGDIPVLRIDDLGLSCCDLIALDIEGSELAALKGAVQTLTRHRPTVIAEDKELGGRFGVGVNDVRDLLTGLGYRHAGRAKRDQIWIPEESAE